MTLELRHGETQIAAIRKADLASEEVPRFLSEWVVNAALTALGKATPTPRAGDAELEADLIAQTCRAMHKSGAWEQAVELAEACLLLDPDRTDLHALIFEMCNYVLREKIDHQAIIGTFRFANRSEAVTSVTAEEYLAYALCGLEHLKAATRSRYSVQSVFNQLVDYSTRSHVDLGDYDWDTDPLHVRSAQREVCRAKLQALKDLIKYGQARGWHALQGITLRATQYMRYCPLLSEDERLDLAFDLVVAMAPDEESFNFQWELARAPFEVMDVEPARYRAWLGKLAEVKVGRTQFAGQCAQILLDLNKPDQIEEATARVDAILAEAFSATEPHPRDVMGLRFYVDRRIKELETPRTRKKSRRRPESPLSADGAIQFVEIKLDLSDPDPDRRRAFRGARWSPAGPGLDLAFAAQAVGLMRRPGQVDPIPYPTGELWPRIAHAAYDGRYVWVVTRDQDPEVLLFEAATLEHVATFTGDDGLPPTAQGCLIAPLAAGRSCLAGCIGFKRSWIANLTFDPAKGKLGRKVVDVFHEAHTAVVRGLDPGNPDLVARPRFAFTLRSRLVDRTIVLVGRDLEPLRSDYQPLVVDPAARSVAALSSNPGQVWSAREAFPVEDHLVLMGRRQGARRSYQSLGTARPPDFKFEPLIDLSNPARAGQGVSGGPVLVIGTEAHVITHDWITVDLTKPAIVRMIEVPGKFHRLRHTATVSSHYGLVLADGLRWWQVRFLDRADDRGHFDVLPQGRTGLGGE
ncbi:MAG: hypothetical protein IID40_01620 [Planctomycetes bacterium]|nr:hypothetical protein [Planctomycetota bacterium]